MSGAAVATAVIAVGTAVATSFEVFAVIAAVGAVVGAVGTVAKIPELQIAGAVIGAVGAIGGLASAAGIFGGGGVESIFGGSGSVLAGDAAFQAASQASDFAASAGALGEGFNVSAAGGPLSGSGPNITNIIDSVTGNLNVTGLDDIYAPVSGLTESPNVTPAGAVEPGPIVRPSDVPGGVDPLADIDPNTVLSGQDGKSPLVGQDAPKTPDAPNVENVVTGRTLQVGQQVGPPDATITSLVDANKDAMPGALDGIWDFYKNNKTLTNGVLQAGFSFVGGFFDGKKPAEIEEMKAKAAYYASAGRKADADASLTEMQRTNMAQPLPSARRVGIINQPQLAPVTGVNA